MSGTRHSTAEPSQGPDFELREEDESLLVDPDNLVGSDNLSNLPAPGDIPSVSAPTGDGPSSSSWTTAGITTVSSRTAAESTTDRLGPRRGATRFPLR